MLLSIPDEEASKVTSSQKNRNRFYFPSSQSNIWKIIKAGIGRVLIKTRAGERHGLECVQAYRDDNCFANCSNMQNTLIECQGKIEG